VPAPWAVHPDASWLGVLGGLIAVIALRLTAELFIRGWRCMHLERAATARWALSDCACYTASGAAQFEMPDVGLNAAGGLPVSPGASPGAMQSGAEVTPEPLRVDLIAGGSGPAVGALRRW